MRVVLACRLLRPSQLGLREKFSGGASLTTMSSNQTSEPLSALFMTLRIPNRSKVAPSTLCEGSRLQIAVSSPIFAMTTPFPLFPLGSYFRLHFNSCRKDSQSDSSDRFAYPSRRKWSRIATCPPLGRAVLDIGEEVLPRPLSRIAMVSRLATR